MEAAKPSDPSEFVEEQAWKSAIEHFAKTLPSSRRKKAGGTLLGFARGPRKHPDLAVKKHPDSVRRDDLEKFFEQLEQLYEDWTVHDYKLIIKQFYRKRKGKRFVDWIKIPRNITSRLGPEDLITRAELQRLLSAAQTVRDKAIIATLLESDFRPHEFLSLRVRNATFDEHGAVLHIPGGKTGPRSVRLIESMNLV
jgi:integrase